MDRQIRRLGIALIVLFAVLFVQINYIQVFAAHRLANNPANQRLLLEEFDVQRGAILARDERTVLALSRATSGKLKYARNYPGGSLYGQITGYYSVIFGRGGLEASQNDYLSGRASELLPQTLVDEILGRDKRGATVVTTIDPKLQKVAKDALGSLPGGVVALDPATGEILAMVANPTYDPNPVSSRDSDRAKAALKQIRSEPLNPLDYSVASEPRFPLPPGSTFKLVTAAAALEAGAKPDTKFPNPPSLKLPQTTHELHNFGNELCLGGAPQITLAQALQVSCNVVFAEVGLSVGADRLVAQAEKFGFNRSIPFELPFTEGSIPPDSVKDNPPATAFSAIGQQSVASDPLQMALVAAAIGNGGIEMQPHIVKEIRDPSGRVIKTFGPEEFGTPISPQTASELTGMMVNVVNAGTGTAAQIPGIQVAGKTGTAQNGTDHPHAWFVCFAPAQSPRIAVGVVVLNGGSLGGDATGGRVAAPIAKAVIQAALGG